MAARARAVRQQHQYRSQTVLIADVRPLRRAVALILAAGFTTQAHAAGIVNLGQATARNAGGGAGGYGGAGVPNLGVSPQQALQASQPSIRNLGHAAQAIAAQIAAQSAAAAAATATASNVPNGLTPGGLQVAPGITFVNNGKGALISQNTDTTNPLLWINANGPQQTVDSSGHVNVNVTQTGQNAILTWQTMNVGKQTTLNFDQSGGKQTNGANNWAVFNRIVDPSGAPSQILGNINAQGAVYVINRNGILFGAGSQVNVHALVASSLDLLNMNDYNQTLVHQVPMVTDSTLAQDAAGIVASNRQFLSLPAGTTGGLAYPESGNSTTGGVVGHTGVPNEVLGLGNQIQLSSPSQYQGWGDVTIAPGASITTHTNGNVSDGGFVMIAAPNVNNGGKITADGGQVVLAAGVGLSLLPNVGVTTNPQVLLPELSGQIVMTDPSGKTIDLTPAGTLTNTGIVQAARGNVNLLGSNVQQNGVVGVTTSVNTPGAITISTVDEYQSNNPAGAGYLGRGQFTAGAGVASGAGRAGLLSFGPESVTAVMPDANGQTATSTPGTVFTAGNIAMTAGSVWFQGGSLIEAPGSSVSVNALTQSVVGYATPFGQTAVPGRIYLDSGATIDVSGLANVELPISSILLTIDRIGQNELADSALLRDGFLFGQKGVVVDSTLTGTRSDGLQWVGSPILNLSGYVNNMPRTVDQLLTNGGTIKLSGNEVMTAAGSSMNLNGGYVHYDGGMVDTTRLVDANGAIVPIGQASPFDTFVGIAGQFTESHPRWGVTKTWYNPLQTGGTYQPEFIVGGNAGTLDLFASQSMVLDGDITAQAFGGSKQTQGNDLPTGGTFNLGVDPKLQSAGAIINLTQSGNLGPPSGEFNLVILQNAAPRLDDLAPGFSFDTPLNTSALNAQSATDPNNVLATIVVPVDTLNAGGFANVDLTADKSNGKGFLVPDGTKLTLQPGGSLKLNGSTSSGATVAGQLIVPSGTVSITAGSSITVGPDALISVAGQWVNNDVQAAPGTTPGNSQFINGGSIALSTTSYSTTANGTVTDRTGSIVLQPGSVLDVSGGAQMQANGTLLMSNGVAAGKGGSLSLLTYNANGHPFGDVTDGGFALPTNQPVAGQIQMDGTIRSAGFAGGGTLTLQALGFQIGGDPAQAPAWDLVLPTGFFATQGFGNYVLNAFYDATVAPGAMVRLTQQNLVPDAVALQRAVSGANLSAAGLTTPGSLDPYHRQATSLTMTAGGYADWNRPDSTGVAQVPVYPGVTGGVSVGQGASVVGDAGASIGLGSPAQVTVLGSLIAPGGSITLSGDSTPANFALPGQYAGTSSFTSPTQSVWLGSNAVLDVSGIALTNPLASPVKNGLTTMTPNTGRVLAGGSVTISDDSGYVVAQAGSKIDVSGTSASFDQLQANGTYASQPVWSNAGTITFGASSGLFFDGTLNARPGAAQAAGGTLTIVPEQNASASVYVGDGTTGSLIGATALIVRQDGQFVPQGLAPGQRFATAIDPTTGQALGTPNGVIQFAADRLNGSGMANLVLGAANNAAPVTVAFAGDVNLTLPGSVSVSAGRIAAIGMDQLSTLLSTPAVQPTKDNLSPTPLLTTLLGEAPQNPLGTTVTIDAPYVALVGPKLASNPVAFKPVATLSNGTLNVNASFIDLENQLQLNNFGQANFTSSGDIRLSSTNAAQTANQGLLAGELYTPGNLTFKAADLYPSTASTFIVDAIGPTDPGTGKPAPTTVTFASNGTSGVPLSAGGTLLVDASNIVQGGTVRAPSGTLVFGVGDPTNVATQTQFNSKTLVATDSVTFANGSVTSVSNGNSVIPYGTTVDGTEWRFNPVAGSTTPDLNAPPSKFVGVNGSSIALNKGATIDLSGGGDLQAAEWIPGTGGTRDVLSQYNVSYASNPTGVAVPVNVGAANVYAILPGAQSPVSAYDPTFAQTLQPSTNGNGTTSTVTASLGVGQAGMGSAIGQSVYLSGVPGLSPGYYTLLPGKYATVPGAYRVTVASAAGNLTPGSSNVLADGTVMTAGYFGNAVTGSRSASPTLFDVQSGPVWQQYSQYTLTSANTFFPTLAAGKGNVAPPLPVDGGQLALAATHALTLGATLNTAPGQGGAPAEVDIASRDIQITGNGSPALSGYLQISATDLDSLNAGSLLIGGTRTATTSGITINPIADSVVVSNNSGSALSGPEILLVTKTDPTGIDPDAANGLRVDAGSAITASGSYPAAKDQPIAIAGDGSLLRVSNGAMTTVTRTGATGTGLLTVGANATLTGGQALTLDSSGNLKVDPSATLSAKAITVDGSAITFTNQAGAAAANLPGFVLDSAGLAQLANAQQVILRSAGAINFVGNVDATFGNSVDLSAGTFASDGGNVVLNGQQIAFTNEAGAPTPAATAGSGTLTVNAKEIDFGTGDKIVSGFGAATMNAQAGIVGQNTGTFDFGAVPLTLNAPVYLADTSSASTLKTSGALTLNNATGTALTRSAVGGAWHLIGGAIADNGATIAAAAGNVSLEATSGNLTIGTGSTVSAAGVAKQFFDVAAYAPAGNLTLTADTGTVDVQAGSTLDFAGASGGGAAGTLTLAAPQQSVNLSGTIKGGASSGYAGGSLSLNTGGAVDLDALAATLASSGVNNAISIRTNSGNLTLAAGHTLTSGSVALTADGGAGNATDAANGNVNIFGTIDASGKAGGEIDLYGHSGVDLEGTLLARGTDPNQRGGKVVIGTNGVFDPNRVNPYNATYGYENIDPTRAGVIRLGGGALIDVSGGTAGGLSNGTVSFRAPLLSDGTVNLALPAGGFNAGKGIVGSRATTLEAYAVWSTTDTTTGAQHFDGVIDPAGWYDSLGHLVAGTFTAQGTGGTTFSFTPDANGDGGGTVTNGTTGVSTALTPTQLRNGDAAIGFGGLSSMYFSTTGPNTDHQTFYGYQHGDAVTATAGTLMGFVQHGLDTLTNPLIAAGVTSSIVPGIELDNPSPSINHGDIQVLSNWNLGAGTSATDLAYRFDGQAPVITLRAENRVKVKASLSDGFFQIANPLGGGGTIAVPPLSTYDAAHSIFSTPSGAIAQYGYGLNYWAMTGLASAPGHPTGGTADEIAEYYALYSAYADYLTAPATALIAALPNLNPLSDAADVISTYRGYSPQQGQPLAPIAPAASEQATNPASYLIYLNQYQTYLLALANFIAQHPATAAHADTVQAPDIQPVTRIATSTINVPGVSDNTPSPTAAADNPLPLLSASLAGRASSSFRVVAGANAASSDPLAVRPTSQVGSSPNAGSVVFDGYTSYLDGNNQLVLAPTMIRTGIGAIDVAAAGNIALYDAKSVSASTNSPPGLLVPGVIYTAGAPAADAPTEGSTISIVHAGAGNQDIFVTPTVNPDSAGDITLHAQGNIVGAENLADTTGAVTGKVGANLSQFWWQWMEVGNPIGTVGATNPATQIVQTSINFGAFDQGVMSVGGNIAVKAGGSVIDLSASLPTTWWLSNANTDNPTVNTVGGGNLTVNAGADILSGAYFVAKGAGAISAGGRIAADSSGSSGLQGATPVEVSTLLALQDGVLNVTARQGADIGQIVDPSYMQSSALLNAYKLHADAQGYSATSQVSVTSTTGDVAIGTVPNLAFIGGSADANSIAGQNDMSFVLPATLNLTAFTGGIRVASSGELYPSASGNLNLLADQTISIAGGVAPNAAGGAAVFGMLDLDPASMPSPTNPYLDVPMATATTRAAHAANALHADDTTPARIYSLNGSIVNGVPGTTGGAAGFYNGLVTLSIDKPALIQAAQDIVNLAFQGQNLRESDITRIVAGRDIYDTSYQTLGATAVPALTLGGPGTLDVEAGRNIGPLTTASQAGSVGSTFGSGIEAVGNANNPNLPHESANINVLFGVGPGVDLSTFVSTYIAPGSSVAGVSSATPALIAFMQQYDAGLGVDTGLQVDKDAAQKSVGTLSASVAWKQFQALPSYVQQLFAEQVLFSVLTQVGTDYNTASSPYYQKYARGYEAINTLFPASFGYTANNLGGGGNGANKTISTGNLDIRSTTIQTQQGGNVSILGPGGQALVGSTTAPPEVVDSNGKVIAGPGSMGILTLEQGNIDIFTDQSVLLAQSRIFTEQGGDLTIWSSNGDINAGKGAKSSADTPAPQYLCDANHYCTVDARGEVTGAGIATLQSVPGSPTGNANLIAPRGTVDAGDAGIRVSGNLNVAALHVANADNIQVQGTSLGVPVGQAVNTGALSAASSAASAASQLAQDLVKSNASGVGQRRWTISVQVEGFGDATDDGRKRKREQVGYDSSSAVSIVGFGQVGPTQQAVLSAQERERLGKI
ncbi:filamentous haemagglutinin family protein [Paraburkholderia bryophila]|uniref:Filamentous hemagglutinin family protein n=1 Tax=Paraburkholderia bryophila TaxID=420952 RepID=A0A329D3T0_9BURK|nr:filamentous haemagglutinin family protein [Paraburkholderia bryophila]RAS38974.1 filamentous hemagglutinin family protein [Paraburkholderia bryophila]